nr:immunoglobulin light chain junction region [Macaca mulatta]
CLQYTISPFTF